MTKDKLILIVDDNILNLQLLGTFLKQKGYKIGVATDGQNALDMIDNRKPDLILLDIMMPEINGFTICGQIKTNPETKDIPVIFLTAKAESEDIIRGFEAGASDYVTKPFNSSELLARVETHLELKLNRDIILSQSNEQKKLLHMLCHDLSNPFQAIVFVAQMHKQYHDTSKLDKLMQKLIKVAERGTETIELVRRMQALEDGKFALEPCNLNDSVYESLFLLAGKFSEKNIRWEFLSNEKSIIINAESISLINSVLTNILTNAIKFSYADSRIIIKAEKNGDRARLTVKDFGIGIPDKIVEKIFDFRESTTRKGTIGEKGTGYGMPLIKKFISAYNGYIVIKSNDINDNTKDHGTEVILNFDLFREEILHEC